MAIKSYADNTEDVIFNNDVCILSMHAHKKYVSIHNSSSSYTIVKLNILVLTLTRKMIYVLPYFYATFYIYIYIYTN